MFPDFGHEWPLWENDHDNYTMEPSDYGRSDDLSRKLRIWYDEWDAGFAPSADPPQWKPGRGRSWADRGRHIANLLRDEVRAFADVEYDGRTY
jgi:hypothetical protein